MADWLRPVFTRTKTPVLGFPDRQSSFSADDKSEDGDIPRLRSTSRVSSYMNVRSSTPPVPQTPDSFTNIRSPESVYHKPSVDHMAESLKVLMMNQSSMTSVPIAYNACILHVLEAYQELRMELAKKESFLDGLKLSHTKDINDFEALATQWEMKEQDYKKELKKLEVFLSQTDGGMEKVTLARTNSAVHGSRAAETIKRGIGTIRQRNCKDIGAESIELFRSNKIAREVTERQAYHPARPPKNSRGLFQGEGIPGKNQLRPNSSRSRDSGQTSPLMFYSPKPELLPTVTKSHLDSTGQLQQEREHNVAFESSLSGPQSSVNSSPDELPCLGSRVGLGIDIDEKPLPEIPSIQELDKSERSQRVNEFGSSDFAPFEADGGVLEMSSFSFKPGDDTSILAQSVAKNLKLKTAASRTYQPRPTNSQERPEKLYTNSQSGEGLRLPKSKAKVHSKPGRNVKEDEVLRRDNSNSSIITQIRAESRRSSVDSSRHSGQNTRQRVNRNSGSNEAVTAAVRALASASTSARNSPRKGSSAGTREGSSRGEESPRVDEKGRDLREGELKNNLNSSDV